MNHKVLLYLALGGTLAAAPHWSWAAEPSSPVLRLRQGAQTLQRRAIVSQRALEHLQAKIKKTKQQVPSASATIGWIGSSIERKGVAKRLKEEAALLTAANKGLAKLKGCQGLTLTQWRPILSAEQQVALSVKNLKSVRSDLSSLHKAKLGQSVLLPYIKQLSAQKPAQAKALQALLEDVQKGLSGAADSLEKGLSATGLSQAGLLLKAHNAYCGARVPEASQDFVAISGGLVDSEKVEQGLQIITDAKDTKSKIKELKSLIKSGPMKTKALGQPVKGGGLFLQIFGEDIRDIVLAEFGDAGAYARHIGRQLDERLAGTLGNLYTHGGQGDLLINDANQVYDRSGNFMGTLDETGHVIPSEQALRGYNPTFQWIVPEK